MIDLVAAYGGIRSSSRVTIPWARPASRAATCSTVLTLVATSHKSQDSFESSPPRRAGRRYRICTSALSPDHEPVGAREGRAAADTHVAADQARLDAVVEVRDRGAREHDRVLELGVPDLHALADGRVGADVGVGEREPRPMIAGPRTVARSSRAPSSITTRPSTRESTSSPSMRSCEVVEDQAVGLEHVLDLARVLPPAVHDVGIHAQAAVHERLDRVGDLELAARRGLDRARRLEDGGVNM